MSPSSIGMDDILSLTVFGQIVKKNFHLIAKSKKIQIFPV